MMSLLEAIAKSRIEVREVEDQPARDFDSVSDAQHWLIQFEMVMIIGDSDIDVRRSNFTQAGIIWGKDGEKVRAALISIENIPWGDIESGEARLFGARGFAALRYSKSFTADDCLVAVDLPKDLAFDIGCSVLPPHIPISYVKITATTDVPAMLVGIRKTCSDLGPMVVRLDSFDNGYVIAKSEWFDEVRQRVDKVIGLSNGETVTINPVVPVRLKSLARPQSLVVDHLGFHYGSTIYRLPLVKHLMGRHNQKKHGRSGTEKSADLGAMPLPQGIQDIGQKLIDSGHRAVVVGGAVRDWLSGKEVHDYDLATSATPEETKAAMADKVAYNKGGEIRGTVLAFIPGGITEITSFRKDLTSDGRRAEVSYTQSLMEDLQRRDFTMNALAYDMSTSEVIGPGKDGSPLGALQDIKDKVVRFVGNGIDRIKEDRLRVLRAIRFATNDRTLHESTRKAIKESVSLELLPGPLSGQRISSEVLKACALPKGTVGLRLMQDLGVMGAIFPEVSAGAGVEQNIYHKADVLEHEFLACEAVNDYSLSDHDKALYTPLANDLGVSVENAAKSILRFTMLLHDVGKPTVRSGPIEGYGNKFHSHDEVGSDIARSIVKRLNLSNEIADRVILGVKEHMNVPATGTTDAAIRRWGRRVGAENIDFLLAVRAADHNAADQVMDEDPTAMSERIRTVITEGPPVTAKMPINGLEVMEITGLKPGPNIRKVQEFVQAYQDEHPEATKEELLDVAKTWRLRDL